MRIASKSSVTWLLVVASITTGVLLARRPERVAAPVHMTAMAPRLQRIESELGRLRAEQQARADRIELAAIERDLDAMIDKLEVAVDAEVAATTDRERTLAHAARMQLQRETHDRAQLEQDRSDELRSRLGE